MSDLIRIQPGAMPWQPTPTTEVVEVLNEYDAPLLAVLKQLGNSYMARCLLGELSPVSLWVYAPLGEVDEAILRQGGPDDIDRHAERLSRGLVTVAVADCAKGIRFAAALEVPNDLSPLDMRGFVSHRIAEQLRETSDESRQLEEALA